MKRQMIIGYGEIGKAIDAILGGADYIIDPTFKRVGDVSVEVMHVCMPYSETFVEDLQAYVRAYNPKHIVIYSTVIIGVTRLFAKAVHSPIEGKHPDLEMSMRQMERWIGANDPAEAQFFNNYFHELGLSTRIVDSSDFTEALKLLSTTEYGLNIEFARYKQTVADSLGMDFELTKEWNREYNRLYRNLGMEKRYQKFVLDAPAGPKGGHCIVPNARILHKQFPDRLTEIVGEL